MSLTSSLAPCVRIVADDLTGACDAAAPFARRGATTQVLLAPPFQNSVAQVQSLCTASRDLPKDEAANAVRKLICLLAVDRKAELFKKIDSVFRGNTLVEIWAALGVVPGYLAVIAPSFPAQGRVCSDGHLHRSDASGCKSLHLRELFSANSFNPRWLSASEDPEALAAAMRQTDAVFCEAVTQQHLQSIVEAARSLSRPILWIGSAGLADALAASLYPKSPVHSALPLRRGRLLILTGSQHPVSHRQLAALGDETNILRVPPTCTEDEIRSFVQTASHHQPLTLLLNGGDTALRVCQALAIDSLCLQGEYAPGIPVATARGGPLQGRQILLKSGGFGEAALLARIASALQP